MKLIVELSGYFIGIKLHPLRVYKCTDLEPYENFLSKEWNLKYIHFTIDR